MSMDPTTQDTHIGLGKAMDGVVLYARDPDGNLVPVATDANGNMIVPLTNGDGGDVNVVEVGGTNFSLGQKAKAASLPATLATDDPVVQVLGAKSDAPAGADDAAGSLIALFKRLLGKFQAGQQEMADSLPVALAEDQPTLSVSLADGVKVVRNGSVQTVLDATAEDDSAETTPPCASKVFQALLTGDGVLSAAVKVEGSVFLGGEAWSTIHTFSLTDESPVAYFSDGDPWAALRVTLTDVSGTDARVVVKMGC